MKPAVFLDRDGTINVDKHYLYRIEDFEYIDGVVVALNRLKNLGFLLIIISNQSGIARGYYSEDEYLSLNEWMLSDLESKGAYIDGSYFCPHHPDGVISRYKVFCDCRKPETGLFRKAIAEHDIDIEKSYAVGDKYRDIAICKETDVQGILLSHADDGGNDKDDSYRKIIWKCRSLLEASEMIYENVNEVLSRNS